MKFVNSEDIAVRLYRHKRHWFNGMPSVVVKGVSGSFGTLNFDFGDEVVSFRIYIMGDFEQYKRLAEIAVLNFEFLLRQVGILGVD